MRAERHVRQHLLQKLYLLYLPQSQYLLQNPDPSQKGPINLQTKFQQVLVQVKQCLRVMKASDCMSVYQGYHK